MTRQGNMLLEEQSSKTMRSQDLPNEQALDEVGYVDKRMQTVERNSVGHDRHHSQVDLVIPFLALDQYHAFASSIACTGSKVFHTREKTSGERASSTRQCTWRHVFDPMISF